MRRVWPHDPEGEAPQYRKFKALWDTGATNSAITQNVVDACGLKETGVTNVEGVHGIKEKVLTFIVNILLPGAVQFPNVTVTLGNIKGVDLIIGMDIIATGDFAITNSGGRTVFSFCIPHRATIDYVKEINAENVKAKRHAKGRRPGKKKRPWS